MATLKTPSLFKDEAELQSVREEYKLLLQAEKKLSDLPKLIRREKAELDTLIPPISDQADRERMVQYEQMLATRKQYRNVLRAQTLSVSMLLMLVLATAALIAWSLRLMQG